MMTFDTVTLSNIRKETDSLGEVDVPAHVLWGAQTQRSLEHFSIGHDLIPREMIAAYATLKKASANVNHAAGRLPHLRRELLDAFAGEPHRRAAERECGHHCAGAAEHRR